MPVLKAPPQLQPNKRPWLCPTCHTIVSVGKGLYRRNRWCDAAHQGRWYFEHPDCAGERYWILDRSGLIYALAEVGKQRRAVVKVGKTIRPFWDRVRELPMFVQEDDQGQMQVWGAKVSDRHQAEIAVHEALTPYRVPGLHGHAREAYVAPLDTVLAAIKQVTGMEPELLWRDESVVL